MPATIFSEDELIEIKSRGMDPDRVLSQIETFKKGFPFSKLVRPCIIGDGIKKPTKEELDRLEKIYLDAVMSGRAIKFVPASGAASRMFKELISINSRLPQIEEKDIVTGAEKGEDDYKAVLEFVRGIKNFAFYDSLKKSMSQHGLDLDDLISKGQYKEILEIALTPKGINLAFLPKGLIEFHQYPGYSRTPFEEHLVEANEYIRDNNGNILIHFTISPEHRRLFQSHMEKALKRFANTADNYEISFSSQSSSTDTIAVDMENMPFRDNGGNLVFRPGGHGALLENLGKLDADIVFIKNIDNVVPDRLKTTTYIYKKALGGYLLDIQERIFSYLDILTKGEVNEKKINDIIEYSREKLSITIPENIENGELGLIKESLISRLNRPLRVCGMVKNEGEPGGGPFWVENQDGSVTPQIVESSQVEMRSIGQKEIWESSTHFNPVDLVCGIRDYRGKPFNLMDFMEPNTGFISIKSKDGRELKALEYPGLWNGSMTYWNTIFIEIPIITFNPVKTVLDLLRKEHQPG